MNHELERIHDKMDGMDCKLDTLLERTVQTETLAQSNRGLIKIILTGILTAVGAVTTFIVKSFIE